MAHTILSGLSTLTPPEDDFDRRIGDVLDELYLDRFHDSAPPEDTAAWLAVLTERWHQLENVRTSETTDLYLEAIQLAATATGLAAHLATQEQHTPRRSAA